MVSRCVPQNVSNTPIFITVLRKPIDRVISQLYFFHGKYKFSAQANQTLELFVNFPQLITETDISNLFQYLNKFPLGHDMQIMEYQDIFLHFHNRHHPPTHSGSHASSTREEFMAPSANLTDDMSTIFANMRSDIDMFGVTEQMPSFFVMLCLAFGLDLHNTCRVHVDHNARVVNMRHFGTPTRPPNEVLFSAEALAAMQQELRLETLVYEYGHALFEHRLQSRFNLTVAEATAKWDAICKPRHEVRVGG